MSNDNITAEDYNFYETPAETWHSPCETTASSSHWVNYSHWDCLPCPKCGDRGFDVEYKRRLIYNYDNTATWDSRLIVTCRTCGYEEHQEPFDEREEDVQEQETGESLS